VHYTDGKDGMYQSEFTKALEFAAKYAGYHAAPEASPGAWIAFRENDTVLAANGVPPERRKLKFFNTDYTFLMERLPGDQSVGQGIINIGPDNQRFGAWARKLPAGKEIKLALNPTFAASLKGGAKIRITYLDDGPGGFSVEAGLKAHSVKMKATGRWQTAEFPIVGNSPKIALTAGKSPLLLHMVEVVR